MMAPGRQRSLAVAVVAILMWVAAAAAVAGGAWFTVRGAGGLPDVLPALLAGVLAGGMLAVLGRGIWASRNWARIGTMLIVGLGLLYWAVSVTLGVVGQIFAGEHVMPLDAIAGVLVGGLLRAGAGALVPSGILYVLQAYAAGFEEDPAQRRFVDRGVRYLLLATAMSAILIVFLIILFTMNEAWQAVDQIGLRRMLLGTVWRPGSIIGTEDAQFGLVPMIAGAILSTFGAVVLGVPLSIGTAILLAEIAPTLVRETVRPAVELLAGIPSVVYGLFGMVVLAPLIRRVQVPYNTGFGLLNASIILAVMIIPTVTNIAEDAIRAVPRAYKEGSLALGATHWQTIRSVTLPAARSGIVAAVILGIGRALGETMAMIMVIGNSIALPEPLNSNPLTLFLSSARTLTGNVAVEINYAAGAHRSALFFTGVLLFVMIVLVNSLARFMMGRLMQGGESSS
jgi:phosphate transport system permease protein